MSNSFPTSFPSNKCNESSSWGKYPEKYEYSKKNSTLPIIHERPRDDLRGPSRSRDYHKDQSTQDLRTRYRPIKQEGSRKRPREEDERDFVSNKVAKTS